MFTCKNNWQLINKILIAIFALMVAYMCVWPWNRTNPSHSYGDQSYKRYGGVLSRSVNVISPISEETTTLNAGTAVIYEFDDSGNPVIIHIWDETCTPDTSGVIDHSMRKTTVTADAFTNPDEINRNYQEYLVVSNEKQAEHQKETNVFKYRFVPSQLIIAIPVGVALWVLLNLLESKQEKKQVFTILFAILFIIFTYIFIVNWASIGALCR